MGPKACAQMREIVAYCPTSKVGLGFPELSLRTALSLNPDCMGVDAGGTDLGPYDLGSGENTAHAREGVKRDLKLLITAAVKRKIPLIVGTAGHSGGEPHLQGVRQIVEEIIQQENLHPRIAYIHAEQKKEFLKRKLSQGKIKPINPWKFSKEYPIDETTIEGNNRIVGVMGVEPFIKALDMGAEVVIAGRSSDPAVIAPVPLMKGFPAGPVWHASQIICDGMGTMQGKPDGVIARIREDQFILEPADPEAKLECSKIIGLALHETGSPYLIHEPSGIIDTSEGVKYEQISERLVKVSGSRFRPTKYTVKLEGTRKAGFRSIFFGGVRDPQIIHQVDRWLNSFKRLFEANLETLYGRKLSKNEYSLNFRVYGKNGVMGPLEPVKEIRSHEIFVLAEVIAPTEEMSWDMCLRARQLFMHFDPPSGSHSGNVLAIPFSPMNIKVGWVYRFTLNHVVEIDDLRELNEMFPIELIEE